MPTSYTTIPMRRPTFQMTTKTLKEAQNDDAGLKGNFFELNESNLVNHIAELRRIANDDSSTSVQNVNKCNLNATATAYLPMLFNVNVGLQQNNNSISSDIELPQNYFHLTNNSSPNSWTTDPASLPGNLRQEKKFGSLSIEEVGLVSRGSSRSKSDKIKAYQESHPSSGLDLVKVSNNKGRRKSLKCKLIMSYFFQLQ